MLRRVLVAVCATAIGLALSVGLALAQSSPTGSALVTQSFSFSSTGSTTALALTGGQSVCAVTVLSTTSFSGLVLIPQAASDGPNAPVTWITASSIGGGAISAAGTYLGSITSYGITNFRVTVGALASGTVSGIVSCSSAGGSGSHVIIDNPANPVYTPQSRSNGAQSAQAALTYNLGYNAAITNWDSIHLDASSVLEVTNGGTQRFTLTSSSTSGSCVSLGTGPGRLSRLWNTGAATTVYLTLYDESATVAASGSGCAAADRLYGDGSTIVVPAGGTMPFVFDVPLSNGLAYRLSGALSANIQITAFGLGVGL